MGSAAGLRSPHNAKAAKEMYCVAACECEVPRDVKGVHRPPSHDDVHDDDEARSTMTTVINSAGAEWSDCILKRFRTRPHLLRCQGAFLKFGATRVTPLPRCILALGIRVRMKLHTVPRHCVSEMQEEVPGVPGGIRVGSWAGKPGRTGTGPDKANIRQMIHKTDTGSARRLEAPVRNENEVRPDLYRSVPDPDR